MQQKIKNNPVMQKTVYSDNYYRLLALTYNPKFSTEIKKLRQVFSDIGHPIDFKKTNNQAIQLKWAQELREKDKTNKLKFEAHERYYLSFDTQLKKIMDKFGLDVKNKNEHFLTKQYFFTNKIVDLAPRWWVGINTYSNKSKTLADKLVILVEPNAEVSDLKNALRYAKKEYADYFKSRKQINKEKYTFERDCQLYILHLKALKKVNSSKAANSIIWNKNPKYPEFHKEFLKITKGETVSRDTFSTIKDRLSKTLKNLVLY